jgi:hypothetical protein
VIRLTNPLQHTGGCTHRLPKARQGHCDLRILELSKASLDLSEALIERAHV